MKKEETSHINVWKKEHTHIIKIYSDENKDEYAYCKLPTIAIIEAYNQLREENIYKALQEVFTSSVLGSLAYDNEFMISAGKALIQQVMVDKKHTINRESGKDEMKKRAAIVRHYFHVDPYQLPINEFYKLVEEALWLQEEAKNQLEQVITKTMENHFSTQSY